MWHREVVLLMLTAIVAVSKGSIVIESDIAQDRIVNGVEVPQGKFPSMVSIQYAECSYHVCGGTIVGESHVLTAASCVERGRSAFEFQVVSSTVNLESSGNSYKVAEIIIHEQYDAETKENDIAIFKIVGKFGLESQKEKIVELPKQNQSVLNELASVLLIGWGSKSRFGEDEHSTRLQSTVVNLIPDGYCELFMAGKFYPDTQVCTSFSNTTGPSGGCMGDQGGPLLLNNIQLGVFSSQRGVCGVPDVHTEVAAFVDWIDSKIQV